MRSRREASPLSMRSRREASPLSRRTSSRASIATRPPVRHQAGRAAVPLFQGSTVTWPSPCCSRSGTVVHRRHPRAVHDLRVTEDVTMAGPYPPTSRAVHDSCGGGLDDARAGRCVPWRNRRPTATPRMCGVAGCTQTGTTPHRRRSTATGVPRGCQRDRPRHPATVAGTPPRPRLRRASKVRSGEATTHRTAHRSTRARARTGRPSRLQASATGPILRCPRRRTSRHRQTRAAARQVMTSAPELTDRVRTSLPSRRTSRQHNPLGTRFECRSNGRPVAPHMLEPASPPAPRAMDEVQLAPPAAAPLVASRQAPGTGDHQWIDLHTGRCTR